MKKPSFFDRLSGSAAPADDFDEFEDSQARGAPARRDADDGAEGQLPVDVYQTGSDIVVRAFVAGVRPDELNVSISRDMVVIEGSRDARDQVADADFFTRELFWGSFSRTILLPQEVDVENSSANAKDGLLTIILPKLDKARQTKLRVRST